MVEEEPLIAEMRRRMREGHTGMFVPRTGERIAYVFHVDAIYDQTPEPSGGGERIA